jgi:HK97 family phage major capsid protein
MAKKAKKTGQTVDELYARQDEIKARMQELDAEFPGEALSEEAREEFNSLREEHLDNEDVISELLLREEQLSELAGNEDDDEHRESSSAAPAVHARKPDSATRGDIYDLSTIRASYTGDGQASRELRDRAAVAVERAHFPQEGVDREEMQGHLERMLERDSKDGWLAQRMLRTGSTVYRNAFSKVIMGAQLSPEESRALSLTGEFGGFAVPFTLDPTIIPTSNGVVNPLRQISRLENITNADTWKGVSSAGTTAAYSAEAAETEEDEFKIAQPEISAERASSLILASFEITQDWVGVQGEIGRAIQDAKDELEATKFLSGTGEDEPFGLLVGATETVATAEEGKLGVADIYKLKAALPPRYVPNGRFLANDGQFDRVRQFDTSGGANLWVTLADARPPLLLGKPAHEMSTMETGLTKDDLLAVYGDFSRYIIVDRLGMSIEVIPHVMVGKKATGQRGFYAFWRNGAKVVDKNGFRVLKATGV